MAERSRVFVAPTVEGWALSVIACCLLASSFIQRVNLLVLVFALLAALLLVGMFTARRNLLRLEARRIPPLPPFVGTPFDVAIEVANTGDRDSYAAVVEDFVDLPDRPANEVLAQRIAKRSSVKPKYTIVSPRRGRHLLGPMTLTTRFPFGLFSARTTIHSFEEVVVFPTLGEMTEEWRRSTGRTADASRNLRPSPERLQEEFHALRDYREGDSLRHIHWLSTARRGHPVVKEFESLSARDVLMIVDPQSTSANDETDALVEAALSFAATACVDLGARIGALGGRIVLVLAGPEPVLVQGQGSPRLVDAALRTLALAEFSGVDDWRTALEQLGPNQCRSAQAWFIGTRPMDEVRREYAARFGFRAAVDAVSVDVSAGDFGRYFRRTSSSTTAPA